MGDATKQKGTLLDAIAVTVLGVVAGFLGYKLSQEIAAGSTSEQVLKYGILVAAVVSNLLSIMVFFKGADKTWRFGMGIGHAAFMGVLLVLFGFVAPSLWMQGLTFFLVQAAVALVVWEY